MVNTRVAQVMNVSAAATMEQLRTLFGFLGKIEDMRMFPKEDSVLPVTVRICFLRFEEPTSVGMAQHLTNTVFLDKALTVLPYPDGVIPEESKALQMVAATTGGLVGMISGAGAGLLPTPPQPLLGQNVSGVSAESLDPTLAALGLPQPPPLANVDPSKIEEIRRTIYVGNLDSGTITAEQLLNFFQKIGEVKYVRMAGDETQPTRFAFVEFSDQGSVTKALAYNGVMFAGRPLKINHSNNAIVKPPAKTQEAIQKELANTMKQVRDAQALIQAAIDPVFESVTKVEKKKSRSRSRSRHHSRSRSRRRSRSRGRSRRSRSRRRSGSRSRSRRSRSPRRRSPRRKSRSRTPPRRARRSRSKSREKRSRSKERRKRSRTPPRGYRSKASRSRSRSRSKKRSKSRSPVKKKSRSRSRSTSPKRSSKHKKDKKRDRSSKDRDKNKDKESRSSSSRRRKEKGEEKEAPEAEAEKQEKKEEGDSKVKRDYDEEEKGFGEEADNNKSEDMDVDSD